MLEECDVLFVVALHKKFKTLVQGNKWRKKEK
jgi:hypothetical protein